MSKTTAKLSALAGLFMLMNGAMAETAPDPQPITEADIQTLIAEENAANTPALCLEFSQKHLADGYALSLPISVPVPENPETTITSVIRFKKEQLTPLCMVASPETNTTSSLIPGSIKFEGITATYRENAVIDDMGFDCETSVRMTNGILQKTKTECTVHKEYAL